MLSRRGFLGIAGGAAATGALAWFGFPDDDNTRRTTPPTTATTAAAAAAGRVLVVLQLAGGNDGLNTLVPTDGRYRDARPTLAVAEHDVVALNAAVGMHPALAPLKPMWDRGDLAWTQGVGFEGASRSHFEALDWWWSAAPKDPAALGWLGRWLDATAGATPSPLRAIALNGGSPALRAEHSPSTQVVDPTRFVLRPPPGTDRAAFDHALEQLAAPIGDGSLADAVRHSIGGAREAVGVLGAALGTSAADQGAASIAGGLGVAAQLMSIDTGTQLMVVTAGGYDTHSAQLSRHTELLTDLATGLTAFFAAGDAGGWSDRVVVMTTSEFGRRVAENGSAGTDHGLGGAHLLAGPAVAGTQVVGEVDLGRLSDGDVAATIDPRSLYAAALDWLGGPTDDVLGAHYDRLGLIRT